MGIFVSENAEADMCKTFMNAKYLGPLWSCGEVFGDIIVYIQKLFWKSWCALDLFSCLHQDTKMGKFVSENGEVDMCKIFMNVKYLVSLWSCGDVIDGIIVLK